MANTPPGQHGNGAAFGFSTATNDRKALPTRQQELASAELQRQATASASPAQTSLAHDIARLKHELIVRLKNTIMMIRNAAHSSLEPDGEPSYAASLRSSPPDGRLVLAPFVLVVNNNEHGDNAYTVMMLNAAV